MELDFETVRALSSPTRIRILNEVLEKETTTTDISKNLGKTKSTVSSHLSILREAGLVEKDQKEGRRRVIYRPTARAKAIIEGKERTVKFSLTSSAVSAIAGISVGYQGLKSLVSTAGMEAASATQQDSITAMETATKMERAAPPEGVLQFSSEVLLIFGVSLLGLSAATFLYGYMIKKLGSDQS